MMVSIKKQFIDRQVKAFTDNDPNGKGLIEKHRIVIDMILQNVEKQSRVLDVGCSDGKILKELEGSGYKRLYGIDIQKVSESSFISTNIKYAKCDIEQEKVPFKGKFDLIIVSDVLEHMFSPQTVLYDLKSILSKNGKIIFSMPNAGWFLNGILLTFFPSKLFVSTAFGPWGHTYQFTFFQLRRMATTLKYKILELKGGKLDNYAFRAGIKKTLFDLFVLTTEPLAKLLPTVFSAHIFGIIENTSAKPSKKHRFDHGL